MKARARRRYWWPADGPLMLDLTQLTPHIARVELMNATRTNIYVVRSPDGDTLVDPGPVGTAPVLLALDRHGELRLSRIVLTHAHPAHAGSAARVARGTGVRVHVDPADAPFLDGTREPLLPHGRRGQLMAALGRVVDLCPPVFRLEPLTRATAIGGLLPISTPGHTPGHVCLWHAGDGALLAGDALVVEDGEPALPPPSLSHDPAAARAALAALRPLPFRHLLPGHGAPILEHARARVAGLLARLGLV
jgi:glyoxylase-like metal-dependent hydrolase (beta-lactamase superfamily II)